jgi:hypothetical protein
MESIKYTTDLPENELAPKITIFRYLQYTIAYTQVVGIRSFFVYLGRVSSEKSIFPPNRFLTVCKHHKQMLKQIAVLEENCVLKTSLTQKILKNLRQLRAVHFKSDQTGLNFAFFHKKFPQNNLSND